jgi:hypothetical protein
MSWACLSSNAHNAGSSEENQLQCCRSSLMVIPSEAESFCIQLKAAGAGAKSQSNSSFGMIEMVS